MQDSTQLAVEHWNRTPLFLSEEARYAQYPWLYQASEFRQHLGEWVLEIGCGSGCDLLQFARHGARAVGVDVTPQHLRLAQQRVANRATICLADATRLPFHDGSFDYVFSHGVLHHLDRPRAMVEEIFRVLRPGRRFNIHVYARYSLFLFGKMIKHGRSWRTCIENSQDPVHIDFYTKRRLRKLFAPAEVTVEKVDCPHLKPLGPLFQGWVGWFLVVKGTSPRTSEPTRRAAKSLPSARKKAGDLQQT
jgi:SAM-dependent methyltransferase